MALPNEHIFKKVHANAERMLEHQVLGWMSQPLENVTSPIPIQPFVAKVIEQCCTDIPPCEKPAVESGEMLVELRKLSRAYGTLYAKLRQAWALYYEQRGQAA